MSIVTDKLKVINPIIITDMIFMVHDFPPLKIATKMFCHYKAMFSYPTVSSSHSPEKIFVREKINDIAFIINKRVRRPFILLPFKTARYAQRMIFDIVCVFPACFAALWASIPSEFTPTTFLTDVCSFSNIPYFWHSLMIAQKSWEGNPTDA